MTTKMAAKRKKTYAKSWICRSPDEHREDLVLCYDHSRHFLVRDDYKRVKRANNAACMHCSEAVWAADTPHEAARMLERRGREKGILDVCSDDTLLLMSQCAEEKAVECLREAAKWRKIGSLALLRKAPTTRELEHVGKEMPGDEDDSVW